MTPPKEKIKVWEWDVFGSGMLTGTYSKDKKQPSLRVRILSRVIMGSKWRKVDCPSYAIQEEIEKRKAFSLNQVVTASDEWTAV